VIVVSNTSPLTNLAAIGQFNLLHNLFVRVEIADGVWAELNVMSKPWPGRDETAAAAWIHRTRDELASLPTFKQKPRTKQPGERRTTMTTRQPLFIVVVAALALGWAATVAADQFPATGQTTVHRTGDDGDIQAGATLSYKDNGDGTITDNNTKLMWEKKSDDGTIHDKDTTYTWDNAFAVHVARLNAGSGFAGHTDWRLPNVKELQSIVNYGTFSPAVSLAFNTNCVAGTTTILTGSCTAASFYWSSTTDAKVPTGAWLVSFGFGNVFAFGKSDGLRVRAVRGGS
jgi:Protein of unknown function (DUF1566)